MKLHLASSQRRASSPQAFLKIGFSRLSRGNSIVSLFSMTKRKSSVHTSGGMTHDAHNIVKR